MVVLGFFRSVIRDILWKCNQFQYKVEIISDNPNPDKLKKNVIYVVGGKAYVKWAYLKCPCGCKDSIMLCLDKNSSPSWYVKQSMFGKATIYPSINKTSGCCSHFFIKEGQLVWVKNENIKKHW